jgi:hypothetical protein
MAVVRLYFLVVPVLLLLLSGCRKEETTVFSNNEIPPYDQVPTILVENYVNRLYIDLIGREPTDAEMVRDRDALRAANLSAAARSALFVLLTSGTQPIEGDINYKEAYFRKFYEDQKGRYLDGASEAELEGDYNMFRAIAINDSLNGYVLGYQIAMTEANKVKAVRDSRLLLLSGAIGGEEMCRRMMFNYNYDQINMNTFNFINATFDDSFGRFPTEAELQAAFPAVENSLTGELFGTVVSTKTEYLQVLVTSAEFKEGLVRWIYNALLARDPSTSDIFQLLGVLGNDYRFSNVQQSIMIGDEYAGFND